VKSFPFSQPNTPYSHLNSLFIDQLVHFSHHPIVVQFAPLLHGVQKSEISVGKQLERQLKRRFHPKLHKKEESSVEKAAANASKKLDSKSSEKNVNDKPVCQLNKNIVIVDNRMGKHEVQSEGVR